MFEAIPSINNAKEKPDQEHLEISAELNEHELNEFRKDLAETFRIPLEGSYFKKLKKIMGVFVLAGLATMAAAQESIAPDVSKERIAMSTFLDSSGTEGDEARDSIREALIEKGHLEISPDLPNMTYKPGFLANQVRLLTVGKEKPHFLKPEIILGKEFVEKNPEKAREYMEKIRKTINSTVILESEKGLGSGAIINTDSEQIIVTNAHVAGDYRELNITFSNGERGIAEVVARDKGKDLAILKIKSHTSPDKNIQAGMSLASDEDFENLKRWEKMAIVGNAMRFPFEVAISKLDQIDSGTGSSRPTGGGKEGERDVWGDKALQIISSPDSRFKMLELYYLNSPLNEERNEAQAKGLSKPGMSGGPMISLDAEGDPKVIGINAFSVTEENRILDSKTFASGGIAVKEVRELLLKNGFNPDKSPTQIRSAS